MQSVKTEENAQMRRLIRVIMFAYTVSYIFKRHKSVKVPLYTTKHRIPSFQLFIFPLYLGNKIKNKKKSKGGWYPNVHREKKKKTENIWDIKNIKIKEE